MKTDTYPQIGSRVSYVRQLPATGEVVTGSAIVKGISYDPNNRVTAHLSEPKTIDGVEGEERFNVDLNQIDPSDDFIERLKVAAVEIKRLEDEGNGKCRAIVAEYNLLCDAQYALVLRAPVEFDK